MAFGWPHKLWVNFHLRLKVIFYSHLLMTIFKIKIRPHPCGDGTVYVRVSAFKEWIKATIQEN